MKKNLAFLITLLSVTFIYSQSKITVTANFPDATFYKVIGENIIQPALGVGSIVLKLDKKDLNKIKVVKEGYEDLIKQFPRTRKWPKNIQVNLENRIVELNVEPYDAVILVDGHEVGSKNYNLVFSHQDEVEKLPENATLIAGSANCPIGMFAIDNHIICTQGHIELDKKFARMIYDFRKEQIGNTAYQNACHTLAIKTDELEVTKNLLKFLRS